MQFNNEKQNNHNNNLMASIFQNNFNINNKYLKIIMNYYNILKNNQNFINNNYNSKANNYHEIKYPHKNGLQNIWQQCYMNAVIECLSNIKEITDYLLSLNENFNTKEKILTVSYRNLLIELFLSGQKIIVPQVFNCVIDELSPFFQGNHATDSKELLFFIIERLHQELNIENKNILYISF